MRVSQLRRAFALQRLLVARIGAMRSRFVGCLFPLTLALPAMVVLAHDSPRPSVSNPTHEHAHAGNAQKPFGVVGKRGDVTRTIRLRMIDEMRFVPDKIEVREGETVRFVLTNSGKLMHELVLGTRKDLAAHASTMRTGESMQHDEPYIAHVAPGQTGEMVWKFNRPSRFDFACLVPGHFEAGMTGTVVVER